MTRAQPPKEAIRAPRGATLPCKGWHQEAAVRMLMNNLDPEAVAAAKEKAVKIARSHGITEHPNSRTPERLWEGSHDPN